MSRKRSDGIFDLKQKALLSLNKLSDRDTFRLAAEELEATAHSLSPDAVAPFLSCILDDSQQKPAVRAQCVRLLATVVRHHQRRLTAPYLPKMVSAIAKRLKDPDGAVRDACADAVSALAAQLADTESAFVAVARPLFETLGDQNKHAQSGSALCLASLVRSAPEPPLSVLQPMLVRTTRLLKNPHFLAKPELIHLNTALVKVSPGTAAAVTAIQDCLKSSEWPTRRAASSALADIALSRGPSMSESSRASCLESLESCRFDKVKPVRDTVLHALQCWRTLSSSETKKVNSTKPRIPLSARSQLKTKQDDWHVEIAVPKKRSICFDEEELMNEVSECSSVTKNFERLSTSMRDVGYEYVHMDDKQDCSSVSNFVTDKFETRSAHGGHNVAKLMGRGREEQLKSQERTSLDSTVTGSESPVSRGCCLQMATEMVCIRKQLLQIQDKQSNLMDLFQLFTAGLMDNLTALQSRVGRLEDVTHGLAQNSPTPRPSTDGAIGRSTATKHGIWKRVRGLLCQGDIDSAYTEALCGGDELIMAELLETTGPVLECLSSTNVAHVLTTLASYLLHQKFTACIFPWLQQVVDLSNIHGPNHLVLSAKTRHKVLSALEEAVSMDFSNPLEKRCFSQIAVKLHRIWGNGS